MTKQNTPIDYDALIAKLEKIPSLGKDNREILVRVLIKDKNRAEAMKNIERPGRPRKLSDKQEKALFATYLKGGDKANTLKLAEKYGVTRATVYNIIHREQAKLPQA